MQRNGKKQEKKIEGGKRQDFFFLLNLIEERTRIPLKKSKPRTYTI
jgi:hypothetical protein